ncbi:unnamed protein product [Rotaria magnacalcarata]|uniref:Uncharacterized protein n=3 Tax=Rotaria magnacalcarata TaxID=392030 RepID=A0A816U084_9BILA|nr:unnamed protein product [Rotaria magnacalcarata]CAF2215883.1 unnamed protein product [Rotaria magnacalcarata]
MVENNHNNNNNNNNVQLNNGVMDVAQGNGHELLSTAQLFTVQGRKLCRQQQQQQNHVNNNDMDQNTIDQRHQDEERELIHDDRMANQHRITTENKRKRSESTDKMDVSRSFSQLSIIQRNPKEKKSTSRNNLSDNDTVHATTNDNQQQ